MVQIWCSSLFGEWLFPSGHDFPSGGARAGSGMGEKAPPSVNSYPKVVQRSALSSQEHPGQAMGTNSTVTAETLRTPCL